MLQCGVLKSTTETSGLRPSPDVGWAPLNGVQGEYRERGPEHSTAFRPRRDVPRRATIGSARTTTIRWHPGFATQLSLKI